MTNALAILGGRNERFHNRFGYTVGFGHDAHAVNENAGASKTGNGWTIVTTFGDGNGYGMERDSGENAGDGRGDGWACHYGDWFGNGHGAGTNNSSRVHHTGNGWSNA
jgi:hypothetical protein